MRIGIDLGGTKIEAVALDELGVELDRRRVPTPVGDYQATVAAIAELVESIEQKLREVGTVGIGTPGAISPGSGLLRNSNSVVLNGMPLDRDIAAALGREVRLANDANCFALSEAADGGGRGANVVFGVILGTGVGGGLVVDGKVLVGPNAIAGEWGHNHLPDQPGDPRPCYCGRVDCVERYLSGPALARDYLDETGDAVTAADVATLAASDPVAARLLDRYTGALARALSSVINIVDPDVIVLGGGLSNIGMLYDRVPAQWSEWIFSDVVATKLVPNRHGDSSGVRGAAWLFD